jgi:predicted permease
VAALGADRLPLGAHIAFDARLAVAAMLAALAMGVALAVPVVWFHLRVSRNALRSESRAATTGRAAQTLRQSFVVTQFALAFVLLAGAGLLGLSLERAMAVYPGFQPDHVLTGQISIVGKKYPSPWAGLAFTERLVDALGRQPGVLSVGVANNVPFSGGNGKSSATVKGYVLRPGEAPSGIYSYGVGGDYFRAMGFRLLAGRFLTAADSRRHERVCVVDEDFARRYWPYTSPLGRQLFEGSQPGPDSEAFTVVGVVDSVKQAGLTDEAAQGAVYYPYIYRPESNIFLVARASVPTESLRFTLQRVVREIDSGLAVNDIQTMNERITDSLVARRSPALLAGMFAAIALLLTGIGTYGVLSYAVAQRNREIGVRMALGAQPSQIRTQFLALGLGLVIAGLALGSAGAWLMGRVMQAVLFHVTGLSPLVLGCAASVLALIALVACLVPARRAALVSPMRVLTEQ